MDNDLLRDLIDAIISGAGISEHTRKLAISMGFGKFTKTIDMQKRILQYQKSPDFDVSKASRQINILTGFLMLWFNGDADEPGLKVLVKRLFDDDDYCNTLDEDRLRAIHETIVPIAVLRNLLKTHQCRFRISQVKNFRSFCQKFSVLILDH